MHMLVVRLLVYCVLALLCFAAHLHGDDSLAHKRGDAAGCVLEGSVVRLGAPAMAQLAHVTLVGVRARGWGWG